MDNTKKENYGIELFLYYNVTDEIWSGNITPDQDKERKCEDG